MVVNENFCQPPTHAVDPMKVGLAANNSWTKKVTAIKTMPSMSPVLHLRKSLVLNGLFLLLPAWLMAQGAVPFTNSVGGEYAVSGELNGDQTFPSTAINSGGGWVVWQDNGIDGLGLGIGARRLDANLNPSGAPLRINQLAAGDQEKPRVALLNNGGAVVVFQGGRQGFQNIYARFLGADGSFASDDVLVNAPTFTRTTKVTTNVLVFRSNHPRYRLQRVKQIVDLKLERTTSAAVASISDGTVVVAYASGRKATTNTQTIVHPFKYNGLRFITNSVLKFVPSSANTMQDVYFQLFTVGGVKIGGEIRANQFTSFNQSGPSVAALNDGNFILTWSSEMQRGEGAIDIMARLFDHNGAPLGDEFMVNTADAPCGSPSVTAPPTGGFVIAWTQGELGINKLDVFARVFSATATPITTGFVVNTERRGEQHTPQITATPGGQLIVWTSLSQDGSREGVYGRWLNDGLIISPEFRLNTTTYLRQFGPTVAADGGNRAVVIWSSYQSMAGFDLFGQRCTAP